MVNSSLSHLSRHGKSRIGRTFTGKGSQKWFLLEPELNDLTHIAPKGLTKYKKIFQDVVLYIV